MLHEDFSQLEHRLLSPNVQRDENSNPSTTRNKSNFFVVNIKYDICTNHLSNQSCIQLHYTLQKLSNNVAVNAPNQNSNS